MKKALLVFLMLSCCYVKNGYADTATLIESIGAEECLCSVGSAAVTRTTRRITLAQAKALVLTVVGPEGRKLPGLGFTYRPGDPNKLSTYIYSKNPRFLRFDLIWDNESDGSVSIGLYDVDSYTGDVFSATASCGEYSSKNLKVLQKKIRRSLHLTDTQYRKLKTNGLECVEKDS